MICNTATEIEILSTGPDLFIDFVANSDKPGQGFKATYQFQPIDENNAAATGCYRKNNFITKIRHYMFLIISFVLMQHYCFHTYI